MFKQPLLVVGVVLLLTFAAGVGLGLSLASDPSRSSVAPKTSDSGSAPGFYADATAQDREQANTLLSSRIRELETELAAQKKSQDQQAIIADRLALFKKYHEEIRLRSFDDGSFAVTPAMADILGLTKEEKSAIQQHLKETQKEMEQLKDADTVLVKQTANSASYEIPVDAKGKDLKDKLTQDLTADIGEDRSALFLEDADFDNYASSFSGFSQKKSTIDVGWTTQNGKPMYTYKESYGDGAMWSDTPQLNLPGNLQKYLPTDSGQ